MASLGFSVGSYGRKALKPKTPKIPKVKATKVRASTIGQTSTGSRTGGQVGAQAYPTYQAQPITPGSTTTRGGLDALTTADVQQKYGYVDQDLKNQYAQARANQAAIPGYYQNYQNQLAQITADQKAANQAAVDQITGLGGTLAAAAGRSAVADQSQMAADAANRGASIDPAALTTATQAAAVNTGNLGTQAALQVGLGNNANRYFGGQSLVGAQAQLRDLANAQTAFGKIDANSMTNALNKGSEATTFRQNYINDDAARVLNQKVADSNIFNTQQDNALNQQVAASNAQAKQDSLAQQQKTQRQNARIKKTQIKTQQQATASKVNQYGYTTAEWAAMTPAQRQKTMATVKAQGRAPKTTKPTAGQVKQQSDYQSQISTIAGYYQNPPTVSTPVLDPKTGKQVIENGQPKMVTKKLSAQEITDMLRTGKNPLKQVIRPEVINVARSLASNGGKGIGPWGRGQAKKAGIDVSPYGKIADPRKTAAGKKVRG